MTPSRKKLLVRGGVALAVVAALILIFFDGNKSGTLLKPHAVTIRATALPLPKGNAEIPSALSLRMTNLWQLEANSPSFGGISALQASGGFLSMVSDTSAFVRVAQSDAAKAWRGTVSLPPAACRILAEPEQRDVESITTDAETGSFWLGFEHRNGVCRVASAKQGGVRFRAVPEMANWPKGSGPEAMARLRNGAFLIFAERPRGNGPIGDMLHVDRDPTDPAATVTVMRYRPPTGYRPVDAAQLPDGRILVLNRRFEIPFRFSAQLSIIDNPKPKAGQIVAGPILARFEGEALGENFEGLAIDDDGESLIIWLVADDNFMSIQKTVLVRMVWPNIARPNIARDVEPGVETRQKPR